MYLKLVLTLGIYSENHSYFNPINHVPIIFVAKILAPLRTYIHITKTKGIIKILPPCTQAGFDLTNLISAGEDDTTRPPRQGNREYCFNKTCFLIAWLFLQKLSTL
jgi:hypothetical protein